jgi:hypothetical protein
MLVGEFLAYFGNKQQQFTIPGFMPVINFSNSVESDELEILQDGDKLNEQ